MELACSGTKLILFLSILRRTGLLLAFVDSPTHFANRSSFIAPFAALAKLSLTTSLFSLTREPSSFAV